MKTRVAQNYSDLMRLSSIEETEHHITLEITAIEKLLNKMKGNLDPREASRKDLEMNFGQVHSHIKKIEDLIEGMD
jgi:hypothetical protein